jgi:hypothetical protein
MLFDALPRYYRFRQVDAAGMAALVLPAGPLAGMYLVGAVPRPCA